MKQRLHITTQPTNRNIIQIRVDPMKVPNKDRLYSRLRNKAAVFEDRRFKKPKHKGKLYED